MAELKLHIDGDGWSLSQEVDAELGIALRRCADVFFREVKMRINAAVFAAAFAVGCSVASAQEMIRGQVIKSDEATGTLSLKRDDGTAGGAPVTEDYKIRDGLVFNAVAPGDKVRVTVESADGKKMITKLEKE